MRGSLVLLLVVLVALVGGVALWVQAARAGSAPAEQAEAPPRRISLLTEAVAYIGTILVLAGAGTAVGQRWDEISTAGRLLLLGAATLLFLGLGILVRPSVEPALQRLTGVAWAVSTGALAAFVGVVNDHYDTDGRTVFVTVATTATVYAAVLWLLHQHAVQHLVLFTGVLLSAASIVAFTVHRVDAWMIAVPLWAIGVAWAVAGWYRRLPPWYLAVPLGLVVALITPAIVESSGLRFGLGIATAAAVMALGVAAAFTPGLAMGSVAMLGYVVGAVTYYFGDTLGVPASLTVVGLLVLVFAVVAMRWHWFDHHHHAT